MKMYPTLYIQCIYGVSVIILSSLLWASNSMKNVYFACLHFFGDWVHNCHLLKKHAYIRLFVLLFWKFSVFLETESMIAWWLKTFAWTDTSRWDSKSWSYNDSGGDVYKRVVGLDISGWGEVREPQGANNHDEYVDDTTKMKNASRQSRDQKVRQCCQMQFWGHHLLLSCSRSFRCFSFFSSCMHHIFFGCMRKYWISFRGCFVFVAWASLDFFQMLFLIFVVVGQLPHFFETPFPVACFHSLIR